VADSEVRLSLNGESYRLKTERRRPRPRGHQTTL